MELQEFKPYDPRLWPYIDRYSLLRTFDFFPGMAPEKSLPDGFVKLFFYFSQDDSPVYSDSNGRGIAWKDGVGGHPTEDCFISLKPGASCFLWVNMHPVFFRKVFGVPIHCLNNSITSWEELLGKEGKALKEQILNAELDFQIIKLLDLFFIQKARNCKSLESTSFGITHFIKTLHGQIDIGVMATKERVSIRSLQRQFLDEVGLSPKYYAKITRFNHVANLVKHATMPLSWHDVVTLCGYYDQAHFIHDVKSLTGKSPTVFYSDQKQISDFHIGREKSP